jgi:hypothetical protein
MAPKSLKEDREQKKRLWVIPKFMYVSHTFPFPLYNLKILLIAWNNRIWLYRRGITPKLYFIIIYSFFILTYSNVIYNFHIKFSLCHSRLHLLWGKCPTQVLCTIKSFTAPSNPALTFWKRSYKIYNLYSIRVQ